LRASPKWNTVVVQRRQASDRLAEATDQADQLAARLAGPAGPLTPEELERSARIAALLDRVIAALDAGVNWTDRTPERVPDWHARSKRILLWSAIGVTVALVWIGLGQFSLMVHGYSWARGRTPSRPPEAGAT
jgi:hypothetical protein